MTAPPRRIFTSAKIAHRSPVENGRHPSAQPACRLSFGLPDRLENSHHQRGINILHRQITQSRFRIGSERASPLVRGLGVSPTRLMGLDVGRGTIAECRRCSRCKPARGTLCPAGLDRIGAVLQKRTTAVRFDPCRHQGDGMQGPKSHFSCAAIQSESEDPGLRTGRTDLEVQTGTVGMIACRSERCDGPSRQSVDTARPMLPTILPRF